MARKELFTTIRTEGAILPSDLLQRIGALDKDLPGLKPADYGLAPTERINEAIARSWTRLQGLWAALREERGKLDREEPAVALTRERWLLPLFDELGYGQLKPRKLSDDLPISHSHGNVPIHLLGVGVPLDKTTRKIPGAAKRNPHGLVQDYLNAADEALYGFVTNGRSLRLLRDNSSLTRQAFVEFDLEGMFDGEVYPDFSLLWLTGHVTRVEGDPPTTCLLERWSQAAAEQGARALDHLREGVKDALISLGGGYMRHPSNQVLRDALRAGELTAQDYYRELLRVVYRLLFLFVAEDREVLHPPEASEQSRARYARHFSTRRLRDLARRHRGGRHPDLWQSLQVVLRALGNPEGLPGLGVPSLGGLFAPGQSPYIDDAEIANYELLAAVRALAFTRDGRAVRVVDYRNLGPEEFGSVYESLLELHPEVKVDPGTFGFVEAGGSERKTTGSYYTPPALVQALLDSALDPVIERAAATTEPESDILGLRVVDPASGSGHFLIAAAHRIAQRLAAVRSGEGSPAPEEVRRALRDVVGRCIYGVDVNPMAVELCKVSLWIEAVDPGKPLSFLDAHIRCGNSLVGTTPELVEVGVPLEAFNAVTGDDKEVAKERKGAERKRQQNGGVTFAEGAGAERLAHLRAEAARISVLPDDTPRAVAAKAEAYVAFIASEPFQAARAAFDAWCSTFYLRKADDTPEVGSDTVAAVLAGHDIGEAIRKSVTHIAQRHRFFHWHLEFPDVLNGAGFDCVIGNPPWETLEFKDQEFFAIRAPEIAAAPGARRKKLIAELHDANPVLFEEFRAALRDSEVLNQFVRSGRFPLSGRGRVNTYALFADGMRSMLSSRGRLGCIVPTGIATDDTTKQFFADLVDRRSLVSVLGFENEDLVFPGIHHATRFCLLTVSGSSTDTPPEFVFFARQASDIYEAWRRFTLTPEDFAVLNPNTRTCPIFSSLRDAEINKAVYKRVGVLIDDTRQDGNPWGVSFMQGLFNMTSDSRLFRERSALEADGFTLEGNLFSRGDEAALPLYEGKMFHQLDHRFGTYEGQTEAQARQGKLPEMNDDQHADPALLPTPRYWVQSPDVLKALQSRWPHSWLLGWRDITGTEKQRTVIASILPPVATGHNVPLWLARDGTEAAVIAALLSSFALDYFARQKVGGTHLTFFIVNQLPIPSPQFFAGGCPWGEASITDWLLPRVLELTYTAWDLEAFARDLKYEGPPFPWNAERRFQLRAELDAGFFHLFGISRDDVDYILGTFPIVRSNEERRYGSYRTKELVVDLYQRMAKAIETGETYQTILVPPPANPSIAHPASSRPDWAITSRSVRPASPTLRLVKSPPKGKARERYVPVVNLKAAAGIFGTAQEVEPEGWVELPEGARATDGAFVAQVIGRSMEPTISDGAWCLFGPPSAGSRTGKVLLVQHRDIADPETGGSYTIKRYRSEKSGDEETLWRHSQIVLEADNRDYEAIVLHPGSESDVRIIGEFLKVIEGA